MQVAQRRKPVWAGKIRDPRIVLRRDENYLIHDMRLTAPCLAPLKC